MSSSDDDVQVLGFSPAPPQQQTQPARESIEQEVTRMMTDMLHANTLEATIRNQVTSLGLSTVVRHFVGMAPFVEKLREMYKQVPVNARTPAGAQAPAPASAPLSPHLYPSTFAAPALQWGVGFSGPSVYAGMAHYQVQQAARRSAHNDPKKEYRELDNQYKYKYPFGLSVPFMSSNYLQQQEAVLAGKPLTRPTPPLPAAAADAAKHAEAHDEDVAAEEEEEEEEMDQANLYAQYRPAKVWEGADHPDPIVESQSLAGVTPPDVTYKHHLSADVQAKNLSNAQLETVLYSMMRFQQELPSGERAGFFLGDGAGVGKGRQIAAITKEFWAAGGRRVLWVSTSRDLAFDARRDLDDMGLSDVPVHPKNKDSPPTGSLDKHYKEGVLFITYSLLTVKGKSTAGASRGSGRKSRNIDDEDEMEDRSADPDAALRGPSSRQAIRAKSAAKKMADRQNKICSLSAHGSRLSQIRDWLKGPDGDGKDALIVFDECHRAKNLLDSSGGCTLTGLAVEILQTLLPKARVLYSSATGASEPQNMMYMQRVGSYGFADMKEMIESLKKSGLGGVEMFAMGLKATGAYLCRSLSYRDAEFRLETIDIEPAFKVLYDRSTQFWSLLLSVLRNLPKGGSGRDMRKGLFWAAHQLFYKGLLIAAKVLPCVKFCQKALQEGMCCVIGMQSTGEANMSAARELEGDEGHYGDLVSAPKMVLHGFITKHLFKGCGELSDASLNCLLAQVYTAVCEWRGLKPAAEEAVVQLKEQARRQAREDKARKAQEEKRRRQEEAEEAEEERRSAAGTARREQGTNGGGASISAGATPAAAGAAAAIRAGKDDATGKQTEGKISDEGEGIEEMEERDLNQALEARRMTAKLSGNFIDLTCPDMDDEKVAQSVAALDAEDLAEAYAAEDARVEVQERAYIEALEEAKATLASLQQAQGQRPGGQTEDGMGDYEAMDMEDKPQVRSCVTAGQKLGRRNKVLVDSDDDEEEVPKRSRAANGKVTMSKINPGPDSSKRRHSTAEEGDEEDLTCPSDEEEERQTAKEKQQPNHAVVIPGSVDDSRASSVEEVAPTRRSTRGQAAAQTQSQSKDQRGALQALLLSRGSCGLEAAREAVKAAEAALACFRPDREEARKDRAKKEADKKAAAEEQKKQATTRKMIDEQLGPSYHMSVLNKPLLIRGKKESADSSKRSKRSRGPDDVDEDEEDEDDVLFEDDDIVDDLGRHADEDRNDPLFRQLSPQLRRVRKLLLRLLDALELPPNPLDQLTELLGGESKVAEMTGRKGMMVRGADGKVSYKQRREEDAAKMVNLGEKEDFMSGRKLIAVISDAASTGISLQADRRAANQRRRFHITLELPWSADRAIQQFGRSHRSNQSSAPVYCLMVSNCGGEYRFAGAVAKRLASLGALLQGDQRAMGAAGNLKSYDIDTSEAGLALKRVYEDICNDAEPMPGVEVGTMPDDYFTSAEIAAAGGLVENIEQGKRRSEYYKAMRACLASVGLASRTSAMVSDVVDFDRKTCTDVPRFLNRMLGLPLHEQQLLFEYFSATLQAVVRKAKSEGKFHEGMTVLRNIPVYEDKRVEVHRDLGTGASTFYVKLRVDDGLTWDAAKERRDAVRDELVSKGAFPDRLKKNGFWIARNDWAAWKRPHVLLCTEVANDGKTALVKYRVQRPYQNSSTIWPQHELLQKYRPLTDDKEASTLWQQWFDCMESGCLHGPNCRAKAQGLHCDMGSRKYLKHIVCGALLPVLHTLFKVHETSVYGRSKLGEKSNPRALRCTVIMPQEEQASKQQQQQQQRQSVLDLTALSDDDEGEVQVLEECTPPRQRALALRPGSSPVSARRAPKEPQTRLMVGFEMLKPDLHLLAQELSIELD